MAKIALITDQHFGVRNDSLAFHDYYEKFYKEVFFPYLEKEDIDIVVDLGDTFERRKHINYVTLKRCREYWFDELEKRNIKLHCIVGNHCTSYKNTNEVNSPDLLLREYSNIIVYSEPMDIKIDGTKIAVVPWICSGNYEQSIDFIDKSSAMYLMGHLELQGFKMYKNSVNQHGMQGSLFGKYKAVMSGHFHHRSSTGNIHYLGTPYEMNWQDYNDPKGFHIFDTDTGALEFISNPNTMFKVVYYDDGLTDNVEDLKDSYIRLVVKNKNNPLDFMKTVETIEAIGVYDLQIDDIIHRVDTTEVSGDSETTYDLLMAEIDEIEASIDKVALKEFLFKLHNESEIVLV